MASNENAFQVELKKQFKADGAHSIRMRHFSMGGMADLYTKHSIYEQPIWIECKFKKDKKVKCTAQQKEFLRKVVASGGIGCWARCEKVEREEHLYMGGYDEDQGKLIQIRKVGEKWLTLKILNEAAKITAILRGCTTSEDTNTATPN